MPHGFKSRQALASPASTGRQNSLRVGCFPCRRTCNFDCSVTHSQNGETASHKPTLRPPQKGSPLQHPGGPTSGKPEALGKTLMVPAGSSLKAGKPRYIQTKKKDLFHGALLGGIKFNKQIHTQHLWGTRRFWQMLLPWETQARERQQLHLLGSLPSYSSFCGWGKIRIRFFYSKIKQGLEALPFYSKRP